MRKWLNIYFDLSRREFNGLVLLASLIFLMGMIPGLYRLMRPELEDIPSEQLAIRKLTTAVKTVGDNRSTELFYFDPNVITSEQWQKLGLSEKQSQSILKYIAKGGSFKSAADLEKMYTISAEAYARIAPYVRITSIADKLSVGNDNLSSSVYLKGESSKPTSARAELAGKPMRIIEINQADSLLLEEIRGIGPTFARRILKYRERVGGFHKKEQLLEVFGLDSAKYEEIKAQVRVDASLIRKIDINTATFDALKIFPYLKYKQINAIIQYRKQHGNYTSAKDLSGIAILNAETIDQLAPYLVF
jgi:competence ComEA-like helix-hairpin-helix protein